MTKGAALEKAIVAFDDRVPRALPWAIVRRPAGAGLKRAPTVHAEAGYSGRNEVRIIEFWSAYGAHSWPQSRAPFILGDPLVMGVRVFLPCHLNVFFSVISSTSSLSFRAQREIFARTRKRSLGRRLSLGSGLAFSMRRALWCGGGYFCLTWGLHFV